MSETPAAKGPSAAKSAPAADGAALAESASAAKSACAAKSRSFGTPGRPTRHTFGGTVLDGALAPPWGGVQ